jgi:hypothetical protein
VPRQLLPDMAVHSMLARLVALVSRSAAVSVVTVAVIATPEPIHRVARCGLTIMAG